MIVKTSYDPKPIPDRRFDWSAIGPNYDYDSPIGYGATEEDALLDLAYKEGSCQASCCAE